MAGNRLQGRSRLGLPPALRDILKFIENADTTTSIDVEANIVLGADNRYIAFGTAGVTDSYIKFDGTNLLFFDSTVGVSKSLTQLAASAAETLDQAFDLGKTIDGANSEANSFQVGDGTNSMKFYGDATDLFIKSSAGDIKFISGGGDVTFDNDNISTTGTISNGTITLNAGGISGCATIGGLTDLSGAGAINLKPSGDTDDYLTFSTAANVPGITTTGACNLSITASGGTIDFGDELLTTTGTVTCVGITNTGSTATQGITNTVAEISTTLGMKFHADNIKASFGASDATDSYIQFNGTHLQFYDSNLGAAVTLTDLAGGALSGPTVTGDMTITDGKLIWSDLVDEVAGQFTFSGVTNDGIDIIANAATTGNIIHVASTSLTSGTGIRVDTLESTLNGGYYFEAYDTTGGGATVFSVAEDGAVIIAGAAADVLTLTLGNMQMSNGDIDMDEGKIEVDTTTNETSYFKKNAAGAAAVVEIENTEVTSTGSALLIDQNATGNAIALEITHDGDLAAIDIKASAARTGDVIAIAMANQLAQKAIAISGAEVAANNTGVIDVRTTGALDGSLAYLYQDTGAPTAASHLLEIVSAGALAGANNGACLKITETGANQPTSYAVYIASTSNEALYVDTGQSLFDELVTSNGGFKAAIADNAGLDGITIDQNDATQDKDGLVITVAGDGYLVKGTVETATGKGLGLICADAQTTSLVTLDGTTTNGWYGANGVGMLNLNSDGTLAHTAASLLNITFSGVPQNSAMGSCMRIVDTGNAAGGLGYSVYISATDAQMEAIRVDDGIVVVDETVTASGGIITKHSDANLAAPAAPTAVELAAAFAFTAQGQMGTLDHNNAATNVYTVIYDGTNYWYVAMTKAV